MPNVIILDQEKGRPVKVTGKQWDMISEAVAEAMQQVKERVQKETGKSITKTIVEDKCVCTIDRGTPEGFSYRDWALIALFCGHMKTSKDIAQFLVEKRFEKTDTNKKRKH